MGGNRAFRRAAARTNRQAARCSRALTARRVHRSLGGTCLAGLAVVGSIGLAGPASAAGYTVTSTADSGTGSLRQALLDANASVGVLDTITFAPSVTGVIGLVSSLSITDPVTITGPGAAVLALDGAGLPGAPILTVGAGMNAPTTLSGLTLTGAVSGGAVSTYASDLVFDAVSISGNVGAGPSGGIQAQFGRVTMVDSELSDNHATGDGGGMWATFVTVTLTDTSVTGNSSAYDGGGLTVRSRPLIVSGGEISGNQAAHSGAGVLAFYSAVSLTGTLVSDNTAGQDGGGLSSQNGSLTVSGGEITTNTATAGGGGGLHTSDTPVTVSGTGVVGNTAGNVGGGLDLSGAASTVTDSTISGNTSPEGSALALHGTADVHLVDDTISGNTGPGAVVRTQNTSSIALDHVTMAANTASAGLLVEGAGVIGNSVLSGTSAGPDLDTATVVAATYSLFGVTTDVTGGPNGNQVGADPQLGALADHGGATLTMLPAATSPVLDAGDPAYVGPPTDQRGSARVAAATGGPAVTDLGAVEAAVGDLAPVVVPSPVPGPTAAPGPDPAPGPTAVSGATPAPAVGTDAQRAALAATGADVSRLLPWGSGLVGGGLLLLIGGRSRRRGARTVPTA